MVKCRFGTPFFAVATLCFTMYFCTVYIVCACPYLVQIITAGDVSIQPFLNGWKLETNEISLFHPWGQINYDWHKLKNFSSMKYVSTDWIKYIFWNVKWWLCCYIFLHIKLFAFLPSPSHTYSIRRTSCCFCLAIRCSLVVGIQ